MHSRLSSQVALRNKCDIPAHALTPVAEVEGTSGLPEMMGAEKSLIDRGIGDMITQSFGATENTFPGFSSGNFSSLLNPGLYFLGTLSQHGNGSTGIVDVTSGNNSFAGVTGFDAGTGYDLASGWGTIDAAKFVPALARFG